MRGGFIVILLFLIAYGSVSESMSLKGFQSRQLLQIDNESGSKERSWGNRAGYYDSSSSSVESEEDFNGENRRRFKI